MLYVSGVYQVDITPEKNFVSIRGHADPLMLTKAIIKLGKRAELIFYNKEPKIEEVHHHKNPQSSGEKHPHSDDHNPNVRRNGREKYFCCHVDDSPKMNDFTREAHKYREIPKKDDEEDIFKHPCSPKMEDFTHEVHEYREIPKKDDDEVTFKHPYSPKMEDFTHKDHEYREVPKKDDDEDIFNHPYFRFRRSASTNRRVPSRDSDNMFPNHTDQHNQSHFPTESSRYDDTRNPQYSRRFNEEPPPNEHHHSRMPPPSSPLPPRMPPPAPTYSHGPLGENRPTSDIDNFLHYFSAENPTGCVVM